MKPDGERIAHLETQGATTLKTLEKYEQRFDSIEAKLDYLVAAHHKQKGFVTGVALAFSTMGGLLVMFWEWVLDHLKVLWQ